MEIKVNDFTINRVGNVMKGGMVIGNIGPEGVQELSALFMADTLDDYTVTRNAELEIIKKCGLPYVANPPK